MNERARHDGLVGRVVPNPPTFPWRRALALFIALVAMAGLPALQAGDILRGGAAGSGPRKNAAARKKAGDEMAAQAQANAQDRLARSTQAIQAVQAMQNAARGIKANSSPLPLPAVPNGLGLGGLDLIGTPTGALSPVQSGGGGGATVTIKQTAPQAILNWRTFNVGKNTVLHFDQKAGKSDVGKWIAFNKVSDPTGAPSQILGSIKADGQVYVINQNGIIFGGASQVNVRTLVASSLPINDNLVARGLLNNPDAQFLFSALAMPAGTKGPTSAFTPPPSNLPDGSVGRRERAEGTFHPDLQLLRQASAEGRSGAGGAEEEISGDQVARRRDPRCRHRQCV